MVLLGLTDLETKLSRLDIYLSTSEEEEEEEEMEEESKPIMTRRSMEQQQQQQQQQHDRNGATAISYGSCDLMALDERIPEDHPSERLFTRVDSELSWSCGDNNNNNIVSSPTRSNTLLDCEAPPIIVTPPPPSPGRQRISYYDEQRQRQNGRGSILRAGGGGGLRKMNSNGGGGDGGGRSRQVSFLEDSIHSTDGYSISHSRSPTPQYYDSTTISPDPKRPSQSLDFQDSWRRKSCRRISSLLQQQQRFSSPSRKKKKKTAKELWAILREHVTSGTFFLDRASNGCGSQHGGSSICSSRPSVLKKRHSSLARNLQKEIRTYHQGLTCQQCLIAIAAYLGVAIFFFNFMIPETRNDWSIIDSMYFAVVTFTTIGFGDLTPPDTHLGRLITCVFALTGVSSLGLALAVLGQRMIDLESQAMDKAQQDVLTLFASNSSSNSDVTSLDASDLSSISSAHQRISEAGASCQNQSCRRKNKEFNLGSPSKGSGSNKLFHWQSKTTLLARHIHLRLQFLLFLGWMLLLSFLVGSKEGWNFSQTFYFAITTSCTIGYGDKVPTSQLGRLCVVLFIPFAVGAMGFFLQQVAELMLKTKRKKTLFGEEGNKMSIRELTVMDLYAMDSDGDGNVDWTEFLEFMIVAMNKVDEDLLWELRYQFDSLDVDDTGILSKHNLIQVARRKLRQSSHKLKLSEYKQYLLKRCSSSQEMEDRNEGDEEQPPPMAGDGRGGRGTTIGYDVVAA